MHFDELGSRRSLRRSASNKSLDGTRRCRAAFNLASGRLPQPIELMRIQRHGCASFRAAVADSQGWRATHEDAHLVETQCDGNAGTFLVLDGHSGDSAAQFCTPALASRLWQEPLGGACLPRDEWIEHSFMVVDDEFHAHVQENPSARSGTTVIGALAAKRPDDSYEVKLLNCGDSRGIILSGAPEAGTSTRDVAVRIPAHLEALDACSESASSSPRWPLLVGSVDHKPNHPTETQRIRAAGGHVFTMGVPRVDGLAVSRSLGDFSSKADATRPAAQQKISCIPDVYGVDGMESGGIIVLGCDGLWDVLSVEFVSSYVREQLAQKDKDLGDMCAELAAMSVESRDNVTVMIVHLVDGSEWSDVRTEMRGFEKICAGYDVRDGSMEVDQELDFLAEEGEIGDFLREVYGNFLGHTGFDKEPQPCAVCGLWYQTMVLRICSCQDFSYCSQSCYNTHWQVHQQSCSGAATSDQEMLVDQFRTCLRNGDGQMNLSELGVVLSELDPEFWDRRNIDELLKAVGAGHKGCVHYEDFINWVCDMHVDADEIGSALQTEIPDAWQDPEALQTPLCKVLKPSVQLADIGAPRAGPWLLIFMDIDGVLNNEADLDLVASQLDADMPLCDPEGRCGVGLNRRCLQLLRLLLASLSEPTPIDLMSVEVVKAEGSRVRLVLSSARRLLKFQLEFLCWALSEVGIDPAFLSGQTASLLRALRGPEVLHYVDECAGLGADVAAWVAVDSSPENVEGIEDAKCVLTSEITGLDATAFAKLREVLVSQDIAWHAARELPEPSYLAKYEPPVGKGNAEPIMAM